MDAVVTGKSTANPTPLLDGLDHFVGHDSSSPIKGETCSSSRLARISVAEVPMRSRPALLESRARRKGFYPNTYSIRNIQLILLERILFRGLDFPLATLSR